MKQIDVLFTPLELSDVRLSQSNGLFVVIDVIRASTTLTVLGEYGLQAAYLATSVSHALEIQQSRPELLLIGEEGGARPSGFDFGNSPSAIANGQITGRSAIFVTTNGTQTILDCRQHASSQIVIASLRNGSAVAGYVLQHPIEQCFIVCSGRGGRVAIDDAIVAGQIVATIAEFAKIDGLSIALTESAKMADALTYEFQNYDSVLRNSLAGQYVAQLGLEADLDWCVGEDITECIPTVSQNAIPDGLIEIRFPMTASK